MVRGAFIGAVALGVLAAVFSERRTIAMGLHHVGGLSWGWAAAASFVEIASMLGLAMLYRDLLRASGAHLSLTWILAASYTANALSIAVPVIGSGMGGRLAFQRFREGGVDAGAASLTLTVAGIVSSVTLASVLSVSAVLSGNPAAALSGVLAAALLVTAVALIAVALRTPKGTARLLGVIAFAVRSSKRLARRPSGEVRVVAQAVLAAVERLRLGPMVSARLILWGSVNWWADVACLIFACWASGIDGLSLGKILLVWAAGAGAATISPTPAGIGAVEFTMVAAMAAVGARGPWAITAVLLYRIISLKGAVSLWAVVYSYRKRRRLNSGARG